MFYFPGLLTGHLRDNPSPLMMHSPQLPQYPPVSHPSPPHSMQPKKVRKLDTVLLGAHLSPDIRPSHYNSICLMLQQRVPAGQAVLKEEKLPPQPVMRGEAFNPAMRPDHHKHPDVKPSQQGHGQQSEDHFSLTFNLEGGAQDIKALYLFVQQV